MKQIWDATEFKEDGFWLEWPGWKCPGGCGETIRSCSGEKPEFNGCLTTYAAGVCCSDCRAPMIAKHTRRADLLRAAGVPKKYAQPFDAGEVPDHGADRWPFDPRQPDIHLECWSGEPSTLVLAGANGRGKSMLSAELLVRFFRAGNSIYWTTPSLIVAEHFDSGDRPIWARAHKAGALVLDEFGRGKHTNAFAHGIIGELIDARLQDDLVTIITTNLSVGRQKGPNPPPSIEAADSAVFDRLTAGLLVFMKGKSKRRPSTTTAASPTGS